MLHTLTSRAARGLAAAGMFGAGVALSGAAWVLADDPPKTEKKEPGQKPAFDPKDVRLGPPPELAELRAAVEAAARKGENVDEVRKKLDALEKALAGKPWVKPKPVEEPPTPRAGLDPLPPNVFPAFPGGRPFQFGADVETIRKAQELMLKAARLRADDPVKAEELMKEAQELLAKGLRANNGLVLPAFPNDPFAAPKPKLGVRVEKVPAAVVKKFDLPAARGVLVAEVLPGTAAEKAGLKADDVIVEFAGKPVGDDPTEFVRTVQGMRGGAAVDIVFYRDGKKETVKGVQLAKLAPNPDALVVPPALPNPRTTQQFSVRNGKFTLKGDEGGVTVRAEGTMEAGKPVPSKIEVTDGDKTVAAESVDKLPAEYRDRAEKVLNRVRVGTKGARRPTID